MSAKDGIVLVVDDAGLPYENPDKTGYRIPFAAYERLVKLAQTYNVKIPVSVTAGFIDINNISGHDLAEPDVQRLINFFKKNRQHLPVWSHGLTHQFENAYTEFGLYDKRKSVPADIQKSRLESSRMVFRDVGLKAPKVFVPPGHCWEPGVTDRLARETGFESIAIREFEKTPVKTWITKPCRRFKGTWSDSTHLKTLYRLGLGLVHNKRKLTSGDYWKTRQYVLGTRNITRVFVHRKTKIKPPHHFFAHIHNFSMSECHYYWRKVIPLLLAYYGSGEEQ